MDLGAPTRRQAAKPPRASGDWTTNGKSLPEVAAALQGETASIARVNADGETIVSVAVPIQRASAVRGALALSTQGGDIDKVIASERWALLRFFRRHRRRHAACCRCSLANTIAEPVRKLAEAAERVRRGIKSRQQIPDFTDRSDEIGHLSRALGDMTEALYSRIDAIESFAADVAHELKNPLTSLRSAVETLPQGEIGAVARSAAVDHAARRAPARSADQRHFRRLAARRRTRARRRRSRSTSRRCSHAVVSMLADSPRSRGRHAARDGRARGEGARPSYFVLGHDSRLAQVITNLVDNACSFSEPGGEVRVRLVAARMAPRGRGAERIDIVVEDDGPGIPPHALERIFERFYTDRPEKASARIPGSACRSRARSCRRIRGGSGRRTGRCRAGGRRRRTKTAARSRRGRALRRQPAGRRMSRRIAATPPSTPARRALVGERGVLDPRPLGRGQERLCARADRRARGEAAITPRWSPTTASSLASPSGGLSPAGVARLRGLIERRGEGLVCGAARAARGRCGSSSICPARRRRAASLAGRRADLARSWRRRAAAAGARSFAAGARGASRRRACAQLEVRRAERTSGNW